MYAVLSHYGSSDPSAKALGAALSVGPLALIAVALSWRWTPRWTAVLITATIAAVLWRHWSFLEQHFEWADLLQQAGAYVLISLSFAHSLFGGRAPLCTRLSLQMHGALEPLELLYLRRATWAWAIFYLGLAAVIVVLFFVVSQSSWSLFVNFAIFGLIILAGVVDYYLRRKLLPIRPGEGLMTLLQRTLIG